MALQNRVTATGEIIAHAARGLLMGNRGIIHDPATRTLLKRRWSTRAWIICVLEFKGHQRAIMSPGTWTELFFLDEVTALAAGHRPCFYCQRSIATEFARAAVDGGCVDKPRAPLVDVVLHSQRLSTGSPRIQVSDRDLRTLPDGVAIGIENEVLVVRGDTLLPWKPEGYGSPQPRDYALGKTGYYVTPELTRRVLAQGYEPLWHPSAKAVIS